MIDLKNIIVILVEPQLPENIGFVARTMMNFGIENLRIVNPRDGWPNIKARCVACSASHIIDNAHVCDSLCNAIKDINFLFAASARDRDMRKDFVLSKNMHEKLSSIANEKKIGFIFGPEASGLNNNDLSLADYIVQIDANSEYSSLNLSHAVSVICYEIFNISKRKTAEHAEIQDAAEKSELLSFFKILDEKLSEKNFFQERNKKGRMMRNIQNTFIKGRMTSQEVRTMHGIITALSKDS